ncbi:MAG TPA: isoleucine--tRNA ligase [Kofleriaceae bacterium]|nr:isoleucine--tRNA ligase [Kofleriaceae bacterium]
MSGPGAYRDTLNLPVTDFPMRADLPRREPELLAEWKRIDLYRQVQDLRADAPRYVLHDGPPYSNGHLHHGHVLNKVLKDMVVKYRTMAGFRSPYIPGWDTHGLPIELAVERELAARGATWTAAELRAACREYALRFVAIQRDEFERLGVFGDWQHPYLTLDRDYEAAVVRALAAFARGGYLYRGKKPVYWCPNDRTALAEAEIEYAEHASPSVYVRFPLEDFDAARLHPSLAGARLALPIWTTTPWTLPANLAIVLHPDFAYVAAPSPRDPGEYLLVARDLAGPFFRAMGAELDPASLVAIPGPAVHLLEGARYRHPLVARPAADSHFRVWFADHVTLDQGTGLVHTAPGHGGDDYRIGVAHGLDAYAPIDGEGRFTDEVPEWRGQRIWDANPRIVARLVELGALLNRAGDEGATVRHSYPHCWRCKGPVVLRATSQWFASIDHAALRERALGEIENTEWIPPWGKGRIAGMIENRPDWTLSRQRVWGVPIPAFHCKACGAARADAAVMDHVADLFAERGADAWYTAPVEELLPPGTTCGECGAPASQLEREADIVDVWFESGASWFALASRDPALGAIDLYLEGSDQHRGWFHSSLLVGIVVGGVAPYRQVLTHGFVLDEAGRPYSKSELEKARREGKKVEYVAPDAVIKKSGAELLRLWTASTDFRTDIQFSSQILAGLSEWYRKLRNTCRFLLGNLADFAPDDHPLEALELSELDRYALACLGDLIARVRAHYDAFEFHAVYRALVDYVAADLSALYLDVAKDRLYSEPPGSPARRAAQGVLYSVASALARLVAPILCFTAEDVWRHLPARAHGAVSVHLADLPLGRELAADDPLAVTFARLLGYRERVTRQLEPFRAGGQRSTDAQVVIAPPAGDRALLEPRLELLAELFIVSRVALAADDAPGDEPVIEVGPAPGSRCERCWRWYEEMAAAAPALCRRCAEAVDQFRAGADARAENPRK